MSYFKPNKIIKTGNQYALVLTQRDGTVRALTKVSEADLPQLVVRRWFISSSKYVYRLTPTGKLAMHRFILGAKKNQIVDHKDGDILNNTRENIRFCSALENARNARPRGGKSKFKGVVWERRKKLWRARIGVGYKRISLGRHKEEIDAAKAYDDAAKLLFKDFAYLNFK